MPKSKQHPNAKDSEGSGGTSSESEVNNNKKQVRKVLFSNTEEAVAYGEKIKNPEEMKDLIGKLIKVMMQHVTDLSVQLQLLNEAYHAYRGDKWYQGNYKGK